MNLFHRRIKIFIVSIFFSVTVFAGSLGTAVNNFLNWSKRWNAQRSMDWTSQALFLMNKLSRVGKREALDIIASGKENELYASLYSYLENNPELVKSLALGRDVKETTEALVASLVGMKRYEDNWIEILWRDEGNKNIFLDLWDVEAARPIMASYIRTEHLIDNPELLLKYWAGEESVLYYRTKSLIKVCGFLKTG